MAALESQDLPSQAILTITPCDRAESCSSTVLIVVVAAYAFFDWLAPEKSHPNWIKNAKSLVMIKSTKDWLISVLPEDLDKYVKGLKSKSPDEQDQDASPPAPADRKTEAAPAGAKRL